MPELPEVELISRSLDSLVAGRTIRTAELIRERLAPASTPAEFSDRLGDKTINFVHRRGKHILIDLSGDTTLIVHLRMSGRFALAADESENPRFTHAIFYLDGDEKLTFDDQRHFGLMKVVATGELHDTKELKKLAPEPFGDEFSIEYLTAALNRSQRSLKEFLLDQTRVCGLGNIYAAEAMFAAGVDPRKRASTISRPRAARLHESIRAVLRMAIEHASSQVVDPENLEGNYFSAGTTAGWYVYGRENEPCLDCGSPIVRLKQGGRSTYFCRRCQRK